MKMILTPEGHKKFRMAANTLARSKKDTRHFASQSKGITNGNSPEKAAALERFRQRPWNVPVPRRAIPSEPHEIELTAKVSLA